MVMVPLPKGDTAARISSTSLMTVSPPPESFVPTIATRSIGSWSLCDGRPIASSPFAVLLEKCTVSQIPKNLDAHTWLRKYATSQTVAGSRPNEVNEFFQFT
jgi:hypothetical protein